MELFQAVILGIVQGLTEFLPVSSSAHLILVPYLFGWENFDNKLTFDIALHLGTALAVLAFFWRDWWELLNAFLKNPKSSKARLLYFLIVGSIPAGIIGLLFNDFVENTIRSPYVIIFTLFIFSLVLWWADNLKGKRELKEVNLKDSLVVGLAQAVALIPGVSRSGITITASLFQGLSRTDAARFSFLLSTPIVLATGALKSKDFLAGEIPSSEYSVFIVGFLTSALVGFLTIKWLLRYISKNSFKIFVYYRIFLAAFLLLLVLWRGY